MDKSNFNNYKYLKDKLDYNYKGYNLKFLIPGYLNFVFDSITPSPKEVIKSFIDSTQSFDLREVPRSKSDTVITYLINRQDYKNLALAAQAQFTNSEVINISSLPKVKFRAYGFSYIKHFFKAAGIVLFRSLRLNFKSKLYLIAAITKIFNQIRLLEKGKYDNHIKKYVSFNSAYREESLLTEFFNKRNTETVTLQHGIFCDFKQFIPFDYINLENLRAKEILCWGQSTIDYLKEKGIDTDKLILSGNMKYKNARIDKVDQSFSSCLVLLGRGLYVKTNDKLLETLAEYNNKHPQKIKFYIKKHPFLLDEDHRQFASVENDIIFLGKEHTVEEVLRSDMIDFSIAVNTTAYYESLALGKPCFRWTEYENEDFYGMDDKFQNLEELEQKIDKFKKTEQSEIKNEMKRVIKYIFNTDL
ncbi:MAG: hypothetical protein ACLVKO_06025 [Dysgonomonas sp.]